MRLKKRSVLGNSVIYITMTVVQKGAAFLLLPLYTYLLSPEQYGIANIVNSVGSFYILLFSFAIDDAVARYFFHYRDDAVKKQEFLGTVLFFNLFVSSLSFIILLIFNNFFYMPFIPNTIALQYLVLGIIIVSTTTLYSVLQKILIIQEKSIQYAINTITYFLINTGLTILFIAEMSLGAKGLLLATAITNSLFFIYSVIYMFLRSKLCYKKEYIYFVLKYSTHLIPNRMASWGFSNFNQVFIGKMLSSSSAGIFKMANNVTSIISVFGNSFAFAYQPWVYTNLENGLKGKQKISLMVNLSTYFFTFIGFNISLFMKDVFFLFIDINYFNALKYIPILVLGQVFSCFTVISIYVLFYNRSMTKYISISTILGAFINVVLCIILISPLGIMGTAIASGIAQCVIYIYITCKVNLTVGIHIEVYKPIFILLGCCFISTYCILSNVQFYIKVIIDLLILVFFIGTNISNIKSLIVIVKQKEV